MVVVIGRTVKLIGAGLDGEVCSTAWIASERCFTGGDKGEVLDSVDGKDNAGYRGDSALIDGWNVPPKIVVVSAFNLPVDRVGPHSINARISCATICGQSSESRGLCNHLSKVTTAIRQILDDRLRQNCC